MGRICTYGAHVAKADSGSSFSRKVISELDARQVHKSYKFFATYKKNIRNMAIIVTITIGT